MRDSSSQLFSVVIVGRPNVGKSTLFNRLVGRRKALVHDLPGVTRDRNVALATRDGRAFQIVDTGGILLDEKNPMAALVEEQVAVALEGGDLVLLVVDSKEGLLPLDLELAQRLRNSGKCIALVVNKVDAEAHEARSFEFHRAGVSPAFSVSAEHGAGVSELWDWLVAQGPAPSVEEGASDGEGPRPVRLAIVGRPNVGKSSLLNRILGQRRALVSDVPGTTRDPVDAALSAGGTDYLLVDTAGIRRKSKTERGAEILSVLLAKRSLEQCDVALLVLDSGAQVSHQDAHIAGLIEQSRRAGCLLLNKWDLVKGEQEADARVEAVRRKMAFLEYLPLERVSALSGRGVKRVLPLAGRIYQNYSQSLPTALLNKELQGLVRRVSPPAIRGKELKLRYATQTGTAPPILTVFTNSAFPPPENYARYLKNGLRGRFPLQGSPLILKFRKD